ncbi:MAG: hypothetical protein P8X42_06485, partial [Calditrichaceae bacterium]
MEWLENVKTWFEAYPWLFQLIIAAGIILVSYFAFWITNKYVIVLLQNIARRSKTHFDDAIIESKLVKRLAYF